MTQAQPITMRADLHSRRASLMVIVDPEGTLVKYRQRARLTVFHGGARGTGDAPTYSRHIGSDLQPSGAPISAAVLPGIESSSVSMRVRTLLIQVEPGEVVSSTTETKHSNPKTDSL